MIRFDHVSFSYGEEDQPQNVLKDITFEIAKGECVVLCGASGCGKTSVTRLMNGLIPHHYEGVLEGQVYIDDMNIAEQALVKTAHHVGSVFQNPRSQFFNVDTTGELAFGCENQGLPVDEIKRRLLEVNTLFDLENLMHRSIFELSGGEKQRIACASVYATHPDVIVLDEPSSNLDAHAIEQLRHVISLLKLNGKTIVISEHRLYYLADLADRYFYLKDGQLESCFTKEEMHDLSHDDLSKLCLRELDASKMIEHCVAEFPTTSSSDAKPYPLISFDQVRCSYESKQALSIEDLTLHHGEIIAVIGNNGAGKSTFAHCLCGLQKHDGSIALEGKDLKPKQRIIKSYMVMQDVNHQLFTESVMDEVTLNVSEQARANVDTILKELNLDYHKEEHPLALSGGQKQRVAIASALCSGKELLIYDEPTSGLDCKNMHVTCKLIDEAAKNTLASLVITHDLEFILRCCTSILHIEDGKIKDYYLLDKEGLMKVKEHFLVA